MSESIARTVDSRYEWFEMLVAYMKMRTWAMWLRNYPDTQYETFELLWPALFDQMLAEATKTAVKSLTERIAMNLN